MEVEVMRAPYNVLVIPYISKSENPLFCIFKRADMGVWQFIAGGGRLRIGAAPGCQPH